MVEYERYPTNDKFKIDGKNLVLSFTIEILKNSP